MLSMHRVNNYGSFWQAFALKTFLERSNNSVEFIDIIPGAIETRTIYKKTFSFSKIKKIPYYLFNSKKGKMFANFQKKVLKCSDTPNYSAEYDAIIIGSDEVFNFVQASPWGFSTQLYGDIPNTHVSSYAACFGYTTFKDIEEKGVKKEITSALNNLKHISVRDQNSAAIIEKLINRKPEIHLDPVLVGDLPVEASSDVDTDNFILIYSYDFRFSDKAIIERIKNLAKEQHCAIYSVGFYQDWCDKNILPDPYELLNVYFKKAKYIITDTFHGTIFSVRLHKKFVTVIRDSNKNKLGDLLKRLQLEKRAITSSDDLKTVLFADIDYVRFEKLREIERKRTEEYLRLCLKQ